MPSYCTLYLFFEYYHSEKGKAGTSPWADRQVERASLNRHLPPNGAQTSIVYEISRGFDMLGLAQTDIGDSIRCVGKCGV